jgi:hypothetical protein
MRRISIVLLAASTVLAISSPLINYQGRSPWAKYRLADDRTRPLFFNPCPAEMITIEVNDGTYRCLSRYPLHEQPGTAWPSK